MLVRVPTIPQLLAGVSIPTTSSAEAIQRLCAFLAPGNVAVLTGAGVSVDSGIRAYRGSDGRCVQVEYSANSIGAEHVAIDLQVYEPKLQVGDGRIFHSTKRAYWRCRPIFYHELVDETEKGHAFRYEYGPVTYSVHSV